MFEKEPEDIFAGVEPTKQEPLRPAGALSPTVPGRPGEPAKVGALPEEIGESGGGSPKKGMLLIIAAVVLILILGGGGYLAWRQFVVAPSETITPAPEDVNTNLPPTNVPVSAPEINAPIVNAPAEEVPPSVLDTAPIVPAPESLDTDNDGLSNNEEIALGTDPTSADTDDDDLSDGDEVKIYLTDPLNPDTDGDGYLDGAEVDAGYDPKGQGRLLEQP